MRKNVVTFHSPGTFFVESRSLPIFDWDLALAVRMSEGVVERYGAMPFSFEFSIELDPGPVPDGEGGMLEVRPRRLTTSGRYFIGGRVETYGDVARRREPRDETLLANMRCNGWWAVVVNERTFRAVQPFGPDDFLLDPVTALVVEGGDSDRLAEYRRAMGELHAVH